MALAVAYFALRNPQLRRAVVDNIKRFVLSKIIYFGGRGVITKEQAIDILERFDFFEGQRAGRELWNDKPKDIQDRDIADFSRDCRLLIEYVKGGEV